MENIVNRFTSYKIGETKSLSTDGYIGIPVDITVLFDSSKFAISSGYKGTPIILYIINSQAERVGTLSDEEIVCGMIDRGYVVTVFDYKDNENAISPKLDYSVQELRNRLMKGEFFKDSLEFPLGNYPETIVVPSGHDVIYNKIFWSFDKHGADGSLDKIVEIWNNDFRGTNAEKIIKWTDSHGIFKTTQIAHDGSQPMRCNDKGEADSDGSYIRVKHTKAVSIEDCVKPDGTPLDLNLYMNIIYPTAPKQKVPVMCLASSAEHLCLCSAKADRPQLNGFLFRGYAGVMFDYGYTPMARNDHYGYFDGFPKAGYITGDNPTYSMQYYDDKRINCAAMRFIRYLSLSKNLNFDTEAIGVYGNSKGAWMTFLGEDSPELIPSKRMHKGHHGETAYENGTIYPPCVSAPQEQPWLTYNGKKLESGANLIYSSCGGTDDNITASHKPMFISCNRMDGSCYSTSNAFVNVCRIYNVPAMWFEIPLGHTLAYGKDLKFGKDTYDAFYDFANYYLKGNPVKPLGIISQTRSFPFNITIRFSGCVSDEEIKKINISSPTSRSLAGSWKSSFGGLDWTFTPDNFEYNTEYSVLIPQTIKGDNNKEANESFTYKFKTPKGMLKSASLIQNKNNIYIEFEKNNEYSKHYLLFENKDDSSNTLGVYEENGNPIAKKNVSGLGKHVIDLSDYINSLENPTIVNLILKEELALGKTPIFSLNSKGSNELIKISKSAKCEIGTAPDGKKAIVIKGFNTIKDYPTEEFYAYPAKAFECDSIIKKGTLRADDLGRRFNINLKIFDTISRYVRVELSHCTSRLDSIADYRRNCYNIITKAGEWIDFSFEYTVYDPMYGNEGLKNKSLNFSCFGNGNLEVPLYVSDLESFEEVAELKIENITFISTVDNGEVLPDGKSDIICPKAPWAKK